MNPAGGVLLVGAGVHTLDPGGDAAPVRALLVDGERIAWTGRPEDAPPARAVDLGRAWITPAFVDAHVHGTATGLAASGVDLAGAGSVAEVLSRLRAHAAASGGGVLLGGPWDDFGWPEGRPPTAAEVSAAAPGRAVVLHRVDAHSCVVDEATLRQLPLERLEGVDRSPDGTPTGWLREEASERAWTLVRERLPAAQLAEARATTCARAAALGIASLHQMGHPGLSGLADTRAWARGEWVLDVQVWWAELDAVASAEEGLRPGGDLFLDGSIGSHTAAVSAGYRDGGHGQLFHDDDAVARFFDAATAAGRGAGVHAIGDRAIEQAVAALEAAARRHEAAAVAACRHRVEHVELPSRDHVRRLAALGAVASVQPAFDAAWGGPDGLYAARFGTDVGLASNPLRWFAEAGVPLAFGSDSTVTPLDPWGGVVAAERHRGGLGLDRRAAFSAHTLGGRYVAGQDGVGPLRAGARADLAVWDGDPLAVPDPRELRCLATVVGGGLAHGDLPLPPSGPGGPRRAGATRA